MSRTARLWKGAGLLTLGGVLLSGVVALGDDGPPLASQLNDLGRQALAQGATAMAQTFFQKALALDPGNADATRGLKDTKAEQDRVVQLPSRSLRRLSRRPGRQRLRRLPASRRLPPRARTRRQRSAYSRHSDRPRPRGSQCRSAADQCRAPCHAGGK